MQLQQAVIASSALPCDFAMPAASDPTMPLEPDNLAVSFTDVAGASTTPFKRAISAGACGTEAYWYYDNNDAPSQINLCPTACSTVENGGTLNVLVGCEAQEIIVIQ